jgi:hypothetical protein
MSPGGQPVPGGHGGRRARGAAGQERGGWAWWTGAWRGAPSAIHRRRAIHRPIWLLMRSSNLTARRDVSVTCITAKCCCCCSCITATSRSAAKLGLEGGYGLGHPCLNDSPSHGGTQTVTAAALCPLGGRARRLRCDRRTATACTAGTPPLAPPLFCPRRIAGLGLAASEVCSATVARRRRGTDIALEPHTTYGGLNSSCAASYGGEPSCAGSALRFFTDCRMAKGSTLMAEAAVPLCSPVAGPPLQPDTIAREPGHHPPSRAGRAEQLAQAPSDAAFATTHVMQCCPAWLLGLPSGIDPVLVGVSRRGHEAVTRPVVAGETWRDHVA